MKKIYLSESGPEVSSLIYSFWRASEDPAGASYESVYQKVKACLDMGINTFDHADIYGDYQIESQFGKVVKENNISRDEIVISTKCGINLPDAPGSKFRIRHYDLSAKHIRKSVEQSLKKLRTDYVDILLLHHFDPLVQIDETASAVSELVHAGKVKHIGVANFTVHQHQLLQSRLGIQIITNHIELNPLKTQAIKDGTIDFIKQQYSRPLAWAPLAGGALLDRNDDSHFNMRLTLKRIAEKYNSDVEQITIAWILKLGALPIMGNLNMQKIKNAAKAVKIKLDREDWYEIYFAALQE